MASWRRSFRLHLTGGTVEQDVEDEIAFHLEMRTQELIEEGVPPHLAREEALRYFGDVEGVRRNCREIGRQTTRGRRWTEAFSELRQDAVFALRQLRRTPGFLLVAVFTLALGIGATTAIFSLLHAVVLRPLPFPHPERLVHLWSVVPEDDHRSMSPGTVWEMQRQARSFVGMGAVFMSSFNLTGDGPPERLTGDRVTAGYLGLFGVRPELGRTFSPADDTPGHERVVVLSHGLWRERFGGDRGILGRTIRLNGAPHEVIGVMPAAFTLRAHDARLWVPLALSAEETTNFSNSYLRVLARLKPGVTPAAAHAEVAAIAKRLETLEAQSNAGRGARVEPYLERLLGGYRKRLMILLGAVGFVLMIACVNVANLLLARGAARSREMAVRAALGAGQGRIVRQLLTESLVLSLAGAVAGLGLAWVGLRCLVAISPSGVPRLGDAGIDGTALLCAVGLGLLASVLSGLVPALRIARPDLQGVMKEGGRSFGAGAHDRVRTGLLIAEVALTLVLLAGAGLLIRSAIRLQQVEIGFDPAGVLTAQLSLPRADYPEPERAVGTVQRVVSEVEHIPGVESAAAVSILPLSGSNTSSTIYIEGNPRPEGQQFEADHRVASPGYFKTLGIAVRRGREFTAADRQGAARTALVNEALAREAWPGQDPVGKRMAYTNDSEKGPDWIEVAGVVGDARFGFLDQKVRPAFYLPMAQADLWGDRDVEMALVVRTAGEPAALAGSLRKAVLGVDRQLPVFDVVTMEEIHAGLAATTRFNMLLLTALGFIGLTLAAVGIYGVIAWFVSQRTQEIGLRMALGATEGRVLTMVAWQALRPVLLGIVLGVAGALAAARAISGLLFEVRAYDPATFAGVVVVLAAAALLASYVPARRAARVEPTRALAP